MSSLKAFWESPEYQPFRALRERVGSSNIIAIESGL